jgi:hypothetical protein
LPDRVASDHATPDIAAPEGTAPEDTSTEATGSGAPGSPAEDFDQPMNRAARRAKGKPQVQQKVYGPGKLSGGRGGAQGHRMWANRRSG